LDELLDVAIFLGFDIVRPPSKLLEDWQRSPILLFYAAATDLVDAPLLVLHDDGDILHVFGIEDCKVLACLAATFLGSAKIAREDTHDYLLPLKPEVR